MVGNGFSPVGNHFSMVGNDFTPVGNHFSMVGNDFSTVGSHFSMVGNDFVLVVIQFILPTFKVNPYFIKNSILTFLEILGSSIGITSGNISISTKS